MVTGSRDFRPKPGEAALLEALLRAEGVTHLHHGDCRGFDRWAAEVAVAMGLTVIEHPYRSELGAAGGPIRNYEMAKAVAATGPEESQVCIACPSGGPGTKSGIIASRKYGLRLIFFR